MAKLFVIAGHGAGDPGACAGGYTEADLVRKLASRMQALGGSDVQVGDTNRNWYADNGIGRGQCPKGVPVLELHMDSASASAKGGHVIIKAGFNADAIDNALASFIGSFLPGRSKTIVGRSDLANPNRAASMGVNYRLVECGFISNDGDRSKFINQMDELAKGILACFGVGVSNQTPAPTPTPTPQPKPENPGAEVHVHYGLHQIGGGWLGEITDFNNSNSDGFAGVPNCAHDMLYARVDRGTLKYRVKTAQDGWLPWVSRGDKNDTVNACAGIFGHAITGVQIYYTTPSGETLKQAWYRSQTTKRAGWLPVCCDDGTSYEQFDGWAGMDGEPLDRLQIKIASANPF